MAIDLELMPRSNFFVACTWSDVGRPVFRILIEESPDHESTVRDDLVICSQSDLSCNIRHVDLPWHMSPLMGFGQLLGFADAVCDKAL